jgi:hypothetical protein
VARCPHGGSPLLNRSVVTVAPHLPRLHSRIRLEHKLCIPSEIPLPDKVGRTANVAGMSAMKGRPWNPEKKAGREGWPRIPAKDSAPRQGHC